MSGRRSFRRAPRATRRKACAGCAMPSPSSVPRTRACRCTFSFTSEYEHLAVRGRVDARLPRAALLDDALDRLLRAGRLPLRAVRVHGLRATWSQRGERLYRERPAALVTPASCGASSSSPRGRAPSGKPLVTTECWGVVDYKDWPLLDWGWVKELCDRGARTASATGRWAAHCHLATSADRSSLACGVTSRGTGG